jgi:ubiquinol-cytochrome c reductase cytochrome b subunit
VLVMAASLLVLFLVPWLDRSPVRSGTFRPMFKWFYWLFVINFIGLTYLGAQPAEGIYVIFAKICTAYYLGYFLIILPVLSRIETPRPLTKSISEAVLGKPLP